MKIRKLRNFLLFTFIVAIHLNTAPILQVSRADILDNDSFDKHFKELDTPSLKNFYENSRFDFSIRYPDRWIISVNENQYTNYITFSSRALDDPKMTPLIPNDEAKFELHILDNKEFKNITDWVKEYIADSPSNPQIVSSYDVNIRNQISILHILRAEGVDFFTAYVPYDDKILFIIGPPIENRYSEIFLKMLQSLKLKKNLDVSDLFRISVARAGYLSKPLSDLEINSWFDHSNPDYTKNSQVVRYDGKVFNDSVDLVSCTRRINCYDGHDGYDYVAPEGTPVYAAGDGVVTIGGDVDTVGGYWLRIWHATEGYSTYYGHLSDYVVTDGNVVRGQLIAYSGATGRAKGPHLHFSVYNSQDGWYRPPYAAIDPYGWTGTTTQSGISCNKFGECASWSGTTTDPWPYNRGYLWDDETPPSWGEEHVSGHIAQDTTWTSGHVYVIDSSVTIDAGVTLTIQPNVVVKFNANASMYVYGTLNAIGGGSGGSFNKIHFTSLKDDSVGGDTNRDGSDSSPAPADYRGVILNTGGSATFDYAVLRYGGKYIGSSYTRGVIKLWGGDALIRHTTITENDYGVELENYGSGTLTVESSTITGNTNYGIRASANGAVLTVTDSTITGNGDYGIYFYGNPATTTITNSTFGGHAKRDAYIGGTVAFTASGNTSTDENAFERYGTIGADETWNPGIPIVVDWLSVPSGKTITVVPGSVVKFEDENSYMNIYGSLSAEGTAENLIYFTSLKDDSVGGDTNRDGSGTGTSPAPGDYYGVYLYDGSVADISNSVFRYGGKYSSGYGVLKVRGGLATIRNSTFTKNIYAIYQSSGFTDIQQSSIYGNTNYGIYNSSATVLMAPFNWWGDASGPYHPSKNPNGKGDRVSDNVHFTPWRGTP